jgi:hypothetical protein
MDMRFKMAIIIFKKYLYNYTENILIVGIFLPLLGIIKQFAMEFNLRACKKKLQKPRN